MDEPQFSEQAFDRAAADLRRVIHAIAGRYLIRGLPLTWRLLHDIETETLADLGLAGRHCAELLALFVRPADYDYPYTDELVTISAGRRVPFIVWLVLDVYGVAALPTTTPAASQADMLDAL
jgi:Protein of unknown function (DUF2471)